MGVVFRGYDPDMARDVAIKVLRSDPSLNEAERDEIRARFDREAKAAGGLNHTGIVAHYERGEIDGNRFIVMEFVEGRSLDSLMREGPRPTIGESLAILRQMAAALDYAHSRGVIHRDIKPANVLIQNGGTVKIADFGIAKCSLLGAATSSSMVIGSPHYMAPEQIEARPVDSRTDQWALAVTAYELLTGAKPFQSDSVVNLFQQILSASPRNPCDLDSTIPSAARSVFSKALSKAADARFETCAAFVEALANAVLPEGAGSGAGVKQLRPVVHFKPAWIAVAVGIVVLFAAIFWWTTTRTGGMPADRRAADPGTGRTPRASEVRRNSRDALDYVWIAPGTFRMGCSVNDTDCRADETGHEVTITKGYWLGSTEVTTGAFKRFCRAAGGHLPAAPDFNPDWSNDKLPISGVSWDDASRFCAWAQGRLPTEAEWEFAARGGVPAARYGSLGQIAWTRENSGQRAREVGTLQPNPYGLFDMIGNVWEWTADRYEEQYYSRSPRADPAGPETGHFRVLRGGSWIRDAAEIRVSLRYPLLPANPDHGVGFRCALDEMP